jgi:hypothetical protein
METGKMAKRGANQNGAMMKLSERLRNHRWKSGSLSPGDHGWDYSDAPIQAAHVLDQLERLLRDLQRSMSEARRLDSEVEARIRIMLAELEGKSVKNVFSAYYILEDKKRRPLPLNVDEAIEILREEFIAGHTHGVLCIEDSCGAVDGEVLEAQGERNWAAFESKARAWFTKAVDRALIREADL